MVLVERSRTADLVERHPMVGLYFDLAKSLKIDQKTYYRLDQVEHILMFQNSHPSPMNISVKFRAWQNELGESNDGDVLKMHESKAAHLYVESELLLSFLSAIDRKSQMDGHFRGLVFRPLEVIEMSRKHLIEVDSARW